MVTKNKNFFDDYNGNPCLELGSYYDLIKLTRNHPVNLSVETPLPMQPVLPELLVQIPPDYDYVTNDNHIIKPGDYYQRKTWRTGEWYNIKRYSPNFANSSLSTIKYAHYSDLVLISKKTEPRFKTEKPYPFGY